MMSEGLAHSPDTPFSFACKQAFPVTMEDGEEEDTSERECIQVYIMEQYHI